MNFDVSLIATSLPKILHGLGLTLNLLVVSTLIGLVLAVGILLMRLSKRAWLVWPAKAYIYFFRGTPLLVQLFVIYHGLPQFGFIRHSILWPILREPYWCSVIALSLNTAAYVSEILRGGCWASTRASSRRARRSASANSSGQAASRRRSPCGWRFRPTATRSCRC